MSRYPIKIKRYLKFSNNNNNFILNFFANVIMRNGKKLKAIKVIKEIFVLLRKKTNSNPLNVFVIATYNCSPRIKTIKRKESSDITDFVNIFSIFELAKIKTNKINYIDYYKDKYFNEIEPLFLKDSLSLGLRFLINNSKKQKGLKFSERVANEIVDAFNYKGSSIKNKYDFEKNVFIKSDIE